MQTLLSSPMGTWIVGGCFFAICLAILGRSIFRRLWRFNKKHHIIAFNDHSVDSLYAWDEDDDI